jgi:hypothetical protein
MQVRPAWLFAAGLIGLASSAQGADPFYLGSWRIDSAVVAPWSEGKRDSTERNRLVGKTVVLKPGDIAGPQPLACRGAKFKLSAVAADMLFQGAFDEMHSRDKKADPAKLAASVGLDAAAVQTLDTGCEIDWHFADQTTAKIGLNDYVYTLKKQ